MAATVVTVAQFRATMSAFADSNKYDDPTVDFWLTVAEKIHSAERWGDLVTQGISLYVAHNLALDLLAAKEAAAGGVPGLRSGIISSESGDSVSVSFDTQGGSEGELAGVFNSTSYGRRWWHLMRLFGAGPLVVGTGGGAGGSLNWSGTPIYYT